MIFIHQQSISRKSEAWISADKQRSEASCLSLRLYFKYQVVVSFGETGSSSVAVILLLCRKSLKIHKLENTAYVFWSLKQLRLSCTLDTSGCLCRLLWLMDSDMKPEALDVWITLAGSEAAVRVCKGARGQTASREIHVCGFCFGLGHLVRMALPF